MNFSRDRRRKILSPFYFYSSLSLVSLSCLSSLSSLSLSLTRALFFNANGAKRADDECLSLSLFYENRRNSDANRARFLLLSFFFFVAPELGFKDST